MNTKNICIVVLRVLGIYCLIEAFVNTRGLYFVYTMPEEVSSNIQKMILVSLFPSIVLLLSGIILILFSKELANRITPTPHGEQQEEIYSLLHIQSILFSIAGVLIFASAIPRASSWISQLVAVIMEESRSFSYPPKVIRESWISFILCTLQMVFGIGLFFGAKRLSSFWNQMRKWGTEKGID